MIVSMIPQSDSGSESDNMSPGAGNKVAERTYQLAGGEPDSTTPNNIKEQFNKTGGLKSPSPGFNEHLPLVMSQRRKQTAENGNNEEKNNTTVTVSKVEKSQGARTITPDGCKGVQIDSSIDMQEEERFKGATRNGSKAGDDIMTNNSLKGKNVGVIEQSATKQQTLQMVPQIHMSTHLFNGDYLVQTVNQNTPSL